MATRAGGVSADFLVELTGLVQYAAGTSQKGVAGRRELNSLGTAHQQWRSEGFFQVGESFAYRGGDCVAPLRGSRNAAGFRDRDKGLEVAEVKVQDEPPQRRAGPTDVRPLRRSGVTFLGS
jgi:hypothetical protein